MKVDVMKFWNSGVVWNVASCDAGQPLSQVRPKLNKKPVKLVKLVALKPATTRKPLKCDVAHYNPSQVTPVS